MFASTRPIRICYPGFIMHSNTNDGCRVHTMVRLRTICSNSSYLVVPDNTLTIGHISERVHKAESGVQEVLTELKIIRQIFPRHLKRQ